MAIKYVRFSSYYSTSLHICSIRFPSVKFTKIKGAKSGYFELFVNVQNRLY